MYHVTKSRENLERMGSLLLEVATVFLFTLCKLYTVMLRMCNNGKGVSNAGCFSNSSTGCPKKVHKFVQMLFSLETGYMNKLCLV